MAQIIGIGIIAYLIFVIFKVVQVLFGDGSTTWDSITGHLVFSAILIVVMILGYFFGDKEEEKNEKKNDLPGTSKEEEKTSPSYNPLTDRLEFTIYRQEFETWWYDSDGDKNSHSTIYASLRFYEDGNVIGIRTNSLPNMNVPDSFTMKGSWALEKNQLSLTLEKFSDIDDSISPYISPKENREMKYHGQIADDNSLIKAGIYKGLISEKTIQIANHHFIKIDTSTLIITASENACDKLEARLQNHPLVISTFQNTGNYYTNGETGPEWFTIHITTASENQQAIEELVKDELIEIDEGAANLFWQ